MFFALFCSGFRSISTCGFVRFYDVIVEIFTFCTWLIITITRYLIYKWV